MRGRLNLRAHRCPRKALALASFWLLLGHPAQIAAQSRTSYLVGTVQDTAGRPVPNAQLEVKGTAHVGLSDSLGSFSIEGIPSGKIRLSVKALGFYSSDRVLESRPGRGHRVSVVLVPWKCASLECEGIQVVPSSPETGRH